jgi:hypothetical protein
LKKYLKEKKIKFMKKIKHKKILQKDVFVLKLDVSRNIVVVSRMEKPVYNNVVATNVEIFLIRN